MPDYTVRPARIFRAGDYPGKGFSLSEAEIDALVASMRDRAVPIRYEHRDGPIDWGRVINFKRDGEWLLGDFIIPTAAWDLIGQEACGISAGFASRENKTLTEVSLTGRPAVGGAAVFASPDCPAVNDTQTEVHFTMDNATTAPSTELGLIDKLLGFIMRREPQIPIQQGEPAQFSSDDVRKLTDKIAALEAKQADLESQSVSFSQKLTAERKAALAARFAACPPAVRELVMPLLEAPPTTVTFSVEEGTEQTTTIQDAAYSLLNAIVERGSILFSEIVPSGAADAGPTRDELATYRMLGLDEETVKKYGGD